MPQLRQPVLFPLVLIGLILGGCASKPEVQPTRMTFDLSIDDVVTATRSAFAEGGIEVQEVTHLPMSQTGEVIGVASNGSRVTVALESRGTNSTQATIKTALPQNRRLEMFVESLLREQI